LVTDNVSSAKEREEILENDYHISIETELKRKVYKNDTKRILVLI
jgi:hypothetical protein